MGLLYRWAKFSPFRDFGRCSRTIEKKLSLNQMYTRYKCIESVMLFALKYVVLTCIFKGNIFNGTHAWYSHLMQVVHTLFSRICTQVKHASKEDTLHFLFVFVIPLCCKGVESTLILRSFEGRICTKIDFALREDSCPAPGHCASSLAMTHFLAHILKNMWMKGEIGNTGTSL